MNQVDGQVPLDEALEVLNQRKNAWVAVDMPGRVAILDRIRSDLLKAADRWVAACLTAKGARPKTHAEGDEWGMLMSIFRQVRMLRKSLVGIQKTGRPVVAGYGVRANGQVTARVFPDSRYDRILFQGLTGEIWMEPGLTVEEVRNGQAGAYHEKDRRGKIVVVLGAGNASCLVPGDFLYKLFVENKVVALKLNPVNAYLGPLIEEAFAALVQGGFLRVLQGGADEGTYLCEHPDVDEIHMTGSERTFDTIVFGPGAEGRARKDRRTPVLTKRFTAELGNITPVIIVPGPWTTADIKEQVSMVGSWHMANAAFNCHTPRMIITHRNWPRRDAFLAALAELFEGEETRTAYYPHAKEIHASFVAAHPEARQFGATDEERTPWTLIADLDPRNGEDICFRTEPYCSLLGETALEADGIPAFIDEAVDFANETLWGTLYAAIYIHPGSLEDPKVNDALERAIEKLRYGTVSVNQRAEIPYCLMLGPWGGFPSGDLYNVQSGIGFTNNSLMFDRPQKSVWRAPFHKKINPGTVTSYHMDEFFRALAHFEASRSVAKFAQLLWTAKRSSNVPG